MITAAAALVVAAITLVAGRRDLTRPAVAFGLVWFLCVALAQVRLTALETTWSTGFTVMVFAGGLLFMLGAVIAGGTAQARHRVAVTRDLYRPRLVVAAALVLFLGGIAGLIYKAHILGGIPLLSGQADVVRARAYRGGSVAVPAWSSALTDGFFLAMWSALAALWLLRGRSSRWQGAALWALAAASLFGVATQTSRNTILFALVVPAAAAYLIRTPGRRGRGVTTYAVAGLVVALVIGGVFAARVAQRGDGHSTFLDRESARHAQVVRPFVPFYISAVYPLQAASRLYRAVPRSEPYLLGAASLLSLPDRAFPKGKPPFGAELVALMYSGPGGPSWSVATYQGRLYGDLGWAGVALGSLLLGLGFGALYRWARARSGFLVLALIGYLAYYAAFMVYDNFLSFSIIAVYDLAVVALVDRLARVRAAATA